MDDIIKKLEAMKKKIADTQSELDKASGRYDAAMAALAKQGYTSIKDAETALKSLESKIDARVEKLDADYDAFIEKYEAVFNA